MGNRTHLVVTETHAQCCTCKEIKQHRDFHKDVNKSRHDCAYRCKICANDSAKKHHHLRMEKDKNYRAIKRDSHLRRLYGITKIEYDKRLSVLSGCEICGSAFIPIGNKIHLDHCHTTNKLRGFLCSKCNQGLGFFNDSVSLLEAAKQYIVKHSQKK